MIPAPDDSESSRKADIVVFAQEEWQRMRQSTAAAAAYVPPPLVIEVVNTNWRDDYRLIAKQPTVTVNRLIDGEYHSQRYQAAAAIISPTFPLLELTTAQIIQFTEI